MEHLLRPPGSKQIADGTPGVIAVCLERGLRALLIIGAVALLCIIELRQYYIFFVQHDLYELVTAGLLRALQILK